MPVRENRIIFLTFLITLVIHLGLLAPLSKWLDRTLLPRLVDESLEIDLQEIQSNTSLPREKRLSEEKKPPKPIIKKKRTSTSLPERPPDLKKPVPPVPVIKKEGLRSVWLKKKPLSTQVDKDPKMDQVSKKPPAAAKKPRVQIEQQKIASRQETRHTEEQIKKKEVEESEPIVMEDKAIPDKTSSQETIRSPLFTEKKQEKELKKEEDDGLPDEIRGTLREGKPEETKSENLQFSMNDYRWTFERFIENWVVDIQKWWKAPIDYITGEMPEGGSLWVQVHLSLSGKLLSYKLIKSNVTSEMELMAIQALIGSLKRPELPQTFHGDRLIINWRFIYPPLRPPLIMRR